MSTTIRTAAGSGKSVYFLLRSESSILKISTAALVTYVSSNYSQYVLSATELGSTGIYEVAFPAAAAAGDFDVFPYEAIDGAGNEAEGDPFVSGAFSIYWSGAAVTSSPGADVDADVALVSLAETKQYLKEVGTTNNVIIAALINQVSQWISNYIGRELVSDEKTEYYSGDGDAELILKRRPLTALSSVYIDSLRQWAGSSLVSSAYIIQKKETGILRAFNLLGNWTSGDSNIKITYTAGYTLDTMPYDIRMAAKRLVDYHFRIGYTNRKADHQSASIANENVTLKDFDIPKDVAALLAPYINYVAGSQFQYAD